MISYLFSASFSDVGDIMKMSEGYVTYVEIGHLSHLQHWNRDRYRFKLR